MLFSPQLIVPTRRAAIAVAATTTWNPADKHVDISLSGGNLIATLTGAGGGFISVRAIGSITGSQKKHFEVAITATGLPVVGLGNATATLSDYPGNNSNGIGYVFNGDIQVGGGAAVANIGSYTAGDTVSVEIDFGAKLIWFAKNTGNWNNDAGAAPASGTGGIDFSVVTGNLFPMDCMFANGTIHTANFGATAYTKAASSGFGNF